MASGERASQIASTSIALTLDLKEHSKSLRLNSYLRAFTKVALHGWTILWLGIGLFIALERLTSVHDPGMRNSVFELLNCLARAYGFPIQAIVQFSNTVMGQTVAAASLLIALSVFPVIYLAKAKEPNLLTLDETGFALYRKDTFDERLLGRVLWADIKSVKMLVPQNASGKLKNSSIEIETLSSDYRGPAIVDDRVLLNLEPRRDDTYTSLWLNALGKAPELGNLIPLVAGQELRHSLIIEKQFASGGQAVTYLASRAQQPDTKVIVKEFLLPLFVEAAEHRARERFERAAKLLQSLEHPKIVKLQEYFIEGHRAFLVLDYIDGQNLKQVVTVKGKQTEEAVLNFASQMSIILSYLHSCTPPIVHRDFTAENLILTSSGELRLIDFDVALEVDQINEQTKMAGKTHYIPPEQFRGNPCPQSDIYAMGATLFYILTAIEPEPLQVNSPKNYTSEISDELNQFVEKCTEPELANRYKNIDAALQALNLMKSI
jgi:tRNA A-37 threonylcarbamoyl transferase component Bud32